MAAPCGVTTGDAVYFIEIFYQSTDLGYQYLCCGWSSINNGGWGDSCEHMNEAVHTSVNAARRSAHATDY